MDEKQLAKLIRKNVAKAEQKQQKKSSKTYDPTLQRKEDDLDHERAKMFEEMRKREF
jgi:hypothetical protein